MTNTGGGVRIISWARSAAAVLRDGYELCDLCVTRPKGHWSSELIAAAGVVSTAVVNARV